MTNDNINNLRQLLCLPDTPALRKQVCALCTNDMMWDMAEAHVPGLKAWDDRQHEIAKALELHKRRHEDGEDYSQCRFRMSDLAGADLSGADLRWANLRGADLSDADLFRADLSRANLSSANLRGADLSRADLRDADLSDADLSGTNPSGTNLSGTNLIGAKYNEHTQFPAGLDALTRDMVKLQ